MTAAAAGSSTEGSGRVAIVTGAASGIGRATANRLAHDGLTVACVDLDAAGLEAIVREIQQGGRSAMLAVADVARDEDCRDAVCIAAQHGPIEVLVNVAGVMLPGDRVDQLSPADWNRVMAINVGSVFSMSRHVIPAMRETGGGVIVNTTSVHAFATTTGAASYAASKGAVVSLTRQMALDYAGDAIRVVAVAPGSVDTPMSHRAAADAGAASLADLGFSADPRAVGRVGHADEVASAIAWLASSGASFVNGTTVGVDGGLLARLL